VYLDGIVEFYSTARHALRVPSQLGLE
jgi:hypothetical protein